MAVEEQEKDTSIASAFAYAADQPFENIGTTLQAMGFKDSGQYLKDLFEAPENYESATESFLNRNGLGYDVGFLPRAVIEQAGQLAGSIASRIAGGAAGAAVGGPVGAVAGAVLAPTLFEAAQIAGPVAIARAKANGRDEPNWEDWSGAGGTALGSGLLNAFGVYGIGKLNSTVLGSTLREGVTETSQGFVEQIGSSALTDTGLQLDPKAAFGEGLIGGTTGGVAQAPSSIYASTRQEIENEPLTTDETPLLPAAPVVEEQQPIVEEPIVEEPIVEEPIVEEIQQNVETTLAELEQEFASLNSEETFEGYETIADPETKRAKVLADEKRSNELKIQKEATQEVLNLLRVKRGGLVENLSLAQINELIAIRVERIQIAEKAKNSELTSEQKTQGSQRIAELRQREKELGVKSQEMELEVDYSSMSISDIFANAPEEFIAGRSIPSLEEAFLERAENQSFSAYPVEEFNRALEAEVTELTGIENLAELTRLRLQDSYLDKGSELFDEKVVNTPFIEDLLDDVNLEEVDSLTAEEIAEARGQFRMYVQTHSAELESFLRNDRKREELALRSERNREANQQLLEDVTNAEAVRVANATMLRPQDIPIEDQYVENFFTTQIENSLRQVAKNKQTRLEGELKFVRADERFLKPDYRKLNYTPGITPVLLKTPEALRLQDNIEVLGGGDLLADLQIDPNFASVSVVREAIQNMPVRDKAINYYNELITGDSKKDKLAQQEIEDSELDTFLKLKGEEEISKEDIDRHMEGHMAGTVVQENPIRYEDIGLNLAGQKNYFQLEHTYIPRLNPNIEEKIELLQKEVEENGVNTLFADERIEAIITRSRYANDKSHFRGDYGQPLFWVRGMSGTLYNDNNKPIRVDAVIAEIQSDYHQEMRNPKKPRFTKRFIDKNTPRFEKHKEKVDAVLDINKKYILKNSASIINPNEDVADDLGSDSVEFNRLDSMLNEISRSGTKTNIKYSPTVNFSILAYDTELPKRFYDGSILQRYNVLDDKIDKLRKKQESSFDPLASEDGTRFDDYLESNYLLEDLSAEFDVISDVYQQPNDYAPAKTVTAVVDVLQQRFDEQPTKPSYLGGQIIPRAAEKTTLEKKMLHDIEKENFSDYLDFVVAEVSSNKKGSAGARIKELATQMGRNVDLSSIRTLEEAVEANKDRNRNFNDLNSFSTTFDLVVPRELQRQLGVEQIKDQLATRMHNKLQTKKKIVDAYKETAQELIQRPEVAELFPKIDNIEKKLNEYFSAEEPKGYKQYADEYGMIPEINQPFADSYVRKGVLSTIINQLKKGGTTVAVPNNKGFLATKTSSQTAAGGIYDLAAQELRDIAAQYDLPVQEVSGERDGTGGFFIIDLQPLRELIDRGEFEGWLGIEKGGLVKAPPALYKVNYGDYGRSYK